MRKIVAGLFSTLDGVIEAPEKWNPPYYDDELNHRHLFEDGDGQLPLTLLESRAHHNGVVALRYSGRGL